MVADTLDSRPATATSSLVSQCFRKILALQPISVLLSQAAQSDTLAHAYTKDGQCTRQSPNNLQGYKCASCLDSSTKF